MIDGFVTVGKEFIKHHRGVGIQHKRLLMRGSTRRNFTLAVSKNLPLSCTAKTPRWRNLTLTPRRDACSVGYNSKSKSFRIYRPERSTLSIETNDVFNLEDQLTEDIPDDVLNEEEAG